MPPRKIRQQTDDNSDSGDEKVDAVPSPAPVLMSGDQLSSLLAAFSKSQAEANRQLVESLWASHGLGSGSKFTTPIVSPSPTPTSNMAKCTARFDGVARDPEAVEAFIDSVEVYKECACVSDDIALRGLPMLMEGEAAIWWRGVRNEVSSWPDALKRLRAMYGVPRPAHKVFRDVFSSEQGDELADSFIVRIRAMLSRLPYQLPEEARLDIIYGLLHKRIRKRLPRDGVSDIETLIEKSRMVEESLVECAAALNIPPQPHKSLPTVFGERSSAPDVTSVRSPRPAGAAAALVRSSVAVAPSSLPQPSPSPRSVKSETLVKKLFCVYCKSRGHVRDSCNKISENKSVSCYGCGEKGFIKSNCPKCNNIPSNIQSNVINRNSHVKDNVFYSVNVNTFSDSHCNDKHSVSRPILHIGIQGYNGTALLDTAARRSIAGYTLYALFQRLGMKFRTENMSVRLADGTTRNTKILLTHADVELSSVCIPIEFIIFPDSQNNETLLGIDFILKARLIIDFSSMTWRSADQPRDIHPLSCENSRDPISCASINLLREDEGKFLSESEKGRLVDLLGEYTDVFEEVGEPTPFSEHRIDTGDHPPIAVPPYRVTPARKEVMRAELDKMLAEDVIEECESAWSAPCVLVPKPNGTYRFCVDYRKLNAVTKTDSYPMPRIDELLQSTNGGCVMSSLDLRSGYWQVQTLDRDKTAFSTPFGTFRFKRMPFGLKNAPATFQRLIDRFRSGSSLQEVAILAYLDDILVISENIDKHFSDLRAVFDRLRVFKLRANRDKCAFAREQVKYLGHVISRSGISPDRDKVSAVLDMKEPTCLRQLRTFLQTCSWFRKFIPNFAKIAEPLTRLTKKSQPWIWGLEQDDAFKSLKRLLTTSPILVQADYTKPFILRTDASDYALGACLLQGESSNDERPIEYASRLLTSAERNYSTTEREALAVVWAVERFRGYIDGHLVHVRSDHQPLKWLFSVKSPSGRLVRWAMKLQAYDLQIEYTPGKVNVIADTLSRPVTELNSPPDCGICPVIVDVPHWDAASTRDAQMADPEISKIITDLEGTDELSVNRWSERGYLLTQGVLYRYAEDSESEEPQLVVPESLRGKVMFECHDSPTAAHGGIQRTIHRISQRFYFPGLRRYVTEYLKTCIECQRYKPSNFKPAGLLQTPVPAQRFEVIAVDLFGPLPKGPCGERWILIVEDTASKWVELFALIDATAEVCAKTLVNEVFMRFGVPRRMISDNGVQFVADVMQKAMFVLGVKQNLIPLYHPEANPVERKNRDLKAHLAILLEGRHQQWPEVLSFVRFAFNSSVCTSTEQTPAYLTFGRELRSPISAQLDLRAVVESENFVPQISPYLSKLAETISTAKENIEHHQDIQKTRADLRRSEPYQFAEGDLVLMKTHVLSNASKGITSKFNPKRDGPYVISKKVSPTSYLLAYESSGEVFGKYHVSDLRPYHAREDVCPEPVIPKRRRGRPRRVVE